jgi:hypothetical protein
VSFEYIFLAVFAAMVLFSAWRFFRSGSFTGALLGGSIETEFGEIPLDAGALQSRKVKVYAMKSPSGERFVGVSLVARAPLAASMIPFKLTATQARELAELLTRASQPHGA